MKKREEELAENHAKYYERTMLTFTRFIKEFSKEVFLHGYKHGVEDSCSTLFEQDNDH
jgi:hypothetical protein